MSYSIYVSIIAREPDKQRKLSPGLWKSPMRPKKSLGQHFLRNNEGILHLIKVLNPENGDFFVEIGPGEGQLTLPLFRLKTQNNLSFKYYGVEKDDNLAQILKVKLSEYDGEIILGDARKLIPELIKKNTGKLKIFGNIPYYLTGNLFRILTEIPEKPQLVLFMIQKEVAERIIGEKEGMSRLKAMLSFFYSPKIVANFPKKDFYPPPKVDSSAILLSLHENSTKNSHLWAIYESLAKHAFSQPRKTLENNLKDFFKGDKSTASKLITKAHLSPSMRPHELTFENLIKLSEMVYNNPDGMQEK